MYNVIYYDGVVWGISKNLYSISKERNISQTKLYKDYIFIYDIDSNCKQNLIVINELYENNYLNLKYLYFYLQEMFFGEQ